MKVTQKKLDDNTVLLEAVAAPAEVDHAFNVAYFTFAQQMGIPYDPNKTLNQIVEERMGIKDLDAVVKDHVLDYLAPFAIDKTDIIPAFPPIPEPQSPLDRQHPFSFKLEVSLKPEFELTSYDPVEITVKKIRLTERDVDDQIERIAEHYAEYVVDKPHPIERGQACLMSIKASVNNEELPDLCADERMYITDSNMMPEGFDDNIVGMNVGETKTFSFAAPDLDEHENRVMVLVECTVTVKEALKLIRPEITDEWVKKNMPKFEDAATFRENVIDDLQVQLASEYQEHKREMASAELAKRFKGTIPDEIIQAMADDMINLTQVQLQQQGVDFEKFIEQQGGEEQFKMMMNMRAELVLKQGYALEALFRHEKLTVTDGDVAEACFSMNPSDPSDARKQLEEAGRSFALREAAERMCASNWLLRHAKITEIESTTDR